MTRVDFYVLPGEAAEGRERLCCRLAEKAYKMGHGVYVHTASEADARRLDELLWTFRDGSFLPHALYTGGPEDTERPAPILLGHDREPPVMEVLINLSPDVPPFFSRFERVAEVIDQNEANRRAGRERFRFYRDRGYALHSHNVG